VETYAWTDKEKVQVGSFTIDRYLSLEEALINALSPPWNKR